MTYRSAFLALVALLLLAPLGAAETAPDAPATEPLESGLIEQAGQRLVQLDVTVSGPERELAQLDRKDFELVVGGHPIEAFHLDSVCNRSAAAAGDAKKGGAATTDEPAPAPSRAPASFLFYFEQNHLTMAGRVRAIEMAEELVGKLVTAGNRAMVVSNGEELRTFSDLTTDTAQLLAALGAMDKDRKQWNLKVLEEDEHIREVTEALQKGNLSQALNVARKHQRDERWRADKALRLFSMTLGRLAGLDPPKIVLYFADTMRSNAGEHYLSFFGDSAKGDPVGSAMATDSLMAALAFDKVNQEASANGIRLYTVQAEGLVAEPGIASPTRRGAGGRDAMPNARRVSDAQSTLVGLARESGGQAFLNGVSADKVAQRIASDLSCLYLISFEPGDLPKDSPLAVRLTVSRPKVKAQVRGQVVIQSDSARLTSRLLAAFAAPDGSQATGNLQANLVPTGFANGKYRALVQIVPEPSLLSGASWDLGFSLVSRGQVREDAAGRIVLKQPAPVVFEAEAEFAPGEYEIVAVAHERTGGQLATQRFSGSWPDPGDSPITMAPIAVLQPAAAIFLRQGASRRSGSLSLGDRPALADRPTALVGLVCGAKASPRKLRVVRNLVGDSSAEFAPVDLDIGGKEPCALFSDVIKAGTMTAGTFRYEVRVLAAGAEMATSSREFAVGSGMDAAVPAMNVRPPG